MPKPLKSETLTAWDMVAIEYAVVAYAEAGKLEEYSALALLKQLRAAKKIRVIYSD